MKKISIFGLGKLGVPLVACLIAKDFEVFGVDLDLKKVESLKQLKSPVYEPEVQEMLNKNGKKLTVTLDGIEAVKNTDVTFVVVATPTSPGGDFSNKFVLDACNVIGKALKQKTGYHLVSITSTVMPGSMEKFIKPTLEEISGKKLDYEYVDQNRAGDHIWWISSVAKFKKHYPEWNFKYNIKTILQEIYDVQKTLIK